MYLKVINKKFIYIIILQLFLLIYISTQKHGYFGDELWTFNISNGSIALFDKNVDVKPFYNRLIEKETFINFFKQDSEKLFDFRTTWNNTHYDSHPPIYYCIINIMSSIFCLFGENINLYTGIIPNFLFFIITQIFLFLISKEVIKDCNISLLPGILYGFSVACIDSVVIVRMYALITSLTCIFVYLHIYAIKMISQNRIISAKILFYIYVVFLIGFLTQLYFIIVSFFTGVGLFVFAILRKQFFEAFKYFFTVACSLLSSIFICNDILLKIFGSNEHTEFISKELSKSNIYNRLLEWFMTLDGCIFICTTVTFFICYVFINKMRRANYCKDITKNGIMKFSLIFSIDIITIYITLICISTLIVVSKITMYLSPRYVVFLAPLCSVCMISVIEKNINICKNKFLVLLFIITVSIFYNANNYKNIMWLFYDQQNLNKYISNNKKLEKFIIVTKEESWWPMLNAFQFSTKIKNTYITTKENIEAMKDFDIKNNDILMLFIEDKINISVLNELMRVLNVKNKKLLYEEYPGRYYILSR